MVPCSIARDHVPLNYRNNARVHACMQANPNKFQMITLGLGSTATVLRIKYNEMIENQPVCREYALDNEMSS